MMIGARDVTLVADDWLSARLGGVCWSLLVGSDEPGGALPDEPGGFISAKVDVTHPHAVAWLTWLHAAGFSLIAVEVGLAGQVRDSVVTGGLLESVRPAAADDESAVREVAARNFSFDRFHRDPQVATVVADRIKSDWAAGFFTGARGTRMLVVDTERGRPGAFVQLIDTEDAVVVDLIAVDTPLRGQGVGRALLAAAVNDAGPTGVMRVGTQLDNVASLRLYNGCGLSIISSRYVLHRHGGQS